jgi:hypothetical protein
MNLIDNLECEIKNFDKEMNSQPVILSKHPLNELQIVQDLKSDDGERAVKALLSDEI